MSTPLPRPVAHVRITKRWDEMPIVVACNPSDKGAKPVWVEEDMQTYATAARADLEAENKRLREALQDCANQSTGPDWTEKQALDFVKQRARAALANTK